MRCAVLLSLIGAILFATALAAKRSFAIDNKNNCFLMDGKPFKYVAGEMHYFRIPHQYWKDRLQKLANAGANAVQTYIEWSVHEPSPGIYKFTGQENIVKFIELAQEVGLYVILRPGPYICAERDFGGYPPWLLTINPNMNLRTSDPSHTFFVEKWFRELMPRLVPLFYGNGGPVIMVQVENEYGSYAINDKNYLTWLRDLFKNYVRDSAVLFTTDGSGTSFVKRGQIPGVFSTVDFGPSDTKVTTSFGPLRSIQPNGPLVNSEYYVGWLSYWGETFSTVATSPVISTMEDLLNNNVSFSMYMFHGGSNFGFSSGSGSDSQYRADITSYDYDAPISEAGDLTNKYYVIQKLLRKYRPNASRIVTKQSKKGDYGKVNLQGVTSLWNSGIGRTPVNSEYPLTFESMAQSYGFVAYTSPITLPTDPSVLQCTLRDRGIIYLDEEEVSVLQYTVINETPLPPTTKEGQNLTILVENMGRRNFQLLSDCTKGLVSNATLDGTVIRDWTIVGYPLNREDILKIESYGTKAGHMRSPAFYTGSFQLNPTEEPRDTFLEISNWGKGVAYINGHNLGRYWHIGPQVTLYVPATFLVPFPARNNVTLFELHFTNPDTSVTFVTEPYLNKTIDLFAANKHFKR